MGAVYDALRSDLIHLLMEHRSQGRFTRAAEGTDQARSLLLFDLTHSIADILVAAYLRSKGLKINLNAKGRMTSPANRHSATFSKSHLTDAETTAQPRAPRGSIHPKFVSRNACNSRVAIAQNS